MNSKKSNARILITGACGFTGRALVNFLRSRGEGDLYLVDKVSHSADVVECDVAIKSEILQLIKKIQPEKIYNLVGSFTNDYETDYRLNVLSAKNILDSIHECAISARVLFIGSAAEYGSVDVHDNPIRESQSLRPVSVYGLTKVFQTQLMDFYHRHHHADVVMARMFNLYGEGVSSRLMAGNISEQVQKCVAGYSDEIIVEDLGVRRDFLHISDAVRYYQLIMNCGVSGEIYNVGSGVSLTSRELIVNMLELAGLNSDKIRISESGKKSRISEIYADINKVSTLEKNN